MADTLEKRVDDIEQVLAHLPQDLDARFAGADARAGSRFDRLGIRVGAVQARVQDVERTLSDQIAALGQKVDKIIELLGKN